MKRRSWQTLGWNIAGILLALLLWELLGRWLGSRTLAPPSEVTAGYVQLLREGRMLTELVTSLRQMIVGFGFACALGMPLGVVMGRSNLADRIFSPWVAMFLVTSVAALVPLLILLLGTGFTFRATIVFLASVWYIVITTYNGARGIDPGLLSVARSFGASRLQTATKVILPALYPYLITGARIGLVHAIRAMVVAEMFVILGYGGMIYQTGMLADTAPLIALLITIMAVSILANALLRSVGRFIAPWYEERTAPT
jgi:ABC-type nitrate/sulfonate/bicarbonate transport system permease component